MILPTLIVTLLAIMGPARAGAPATPPASRQAQPQSGIISLSLIEALSAIKQPELVGIFLFVAEPDGPAAFANFLVRDMKALKRYTEKLEDDRKVAQGLTGWDHEVCANLINFYASSAGGVFGRPDAKRMSKINQCVLSHVVALEAITAARKK